MVELAIRHPAGQPVQIKNIAKGHGISPRFLVQIMLQLKGAGLVASSRGAAGGYQLSRSPDEIDLAEIINSIDHSPRPQSALTALPKTQVVQTLRAVWRDVNQAEREILANTSLADLVQRTRHRDATSYDI